jgi:hypothetical protein
MATSPFIDATRFDSIRRALDPELDSDVLPDDVIEDPVYLTRAAQKVVLLDPLAETRTGEQEEAIKMATIFLTAALLAPVLSQVITEQFVDYRARYNPISQMELVSMLNGAAADQIQIAIAADPPQLFRKASGFYLGRGKSYYRRRSCI